MPSLILVPTSLTTIGSAFAIAGSMIGGFLTVMGFVGAMLSTAGVALAALLSPIGLVSIAVIGLGAYAGVNVLGVGRCRDRTPERISQQLRRLCTTGYDLGAKAGRSRDRAFYDAVLQHFGSWRNALAASGINLANVSRRRPKHLDREVMILWLQQRQAAGKSLKWTAVCLENRDYALAIRRTLGRWRKTLDATGVSEAK